MKYKVIVDLMPICHRCGYSTNYVLENTETGEFICPSCLNEEEHLELKKELEN